MKHLDYFTTTDPDKIDWSVGKYEYYVRKIEEVPEGVNTPIVDTLPPLFFKEW